jgi:hypothetical protein
LTVDLNIFGYLGIDARDYHDQDQCDRHRHDCDRPEADLPKDFDDERRQERNE